MHFAFSKYIVAVSLNIISLEPQRTLRQTYSPVAALKQYLL